jgi:DtxR family Mn-dependent transcriptional regulator
LTEKGLSEAKRLAHKVRLIDRFLVRALGLDSAAAQVEAVALAHAASPRLEQALAEYLNEPAAGG